MGTFAGVETAQLCGKSKIASEVETMIAVLIIVSCINYCRYIFLVWVLFAGVETASETIQGSRLLLILLTGRAGTSMMSRWGEFNNHALKHHVNPSNHQQCGNTISARIEMITISAIEILYNLM